MIIHYIPLRFVCGPSYWLHGHEPVAVIQDHWFWEIIKAQERREVVAIPLTDGSALLYVLYPPTEAQFQYFGVTGIFKCLPQFLCGYFLTTQWVARDWFGTLPPFFPLCKINKSAEIS